MRMKIQKVFVVITPFQESNFRELFPDDFDSSETLVFKSVFVDFRLKSSLQEEVKDYDFSRERLFRNPLKNYRITKSKVEQVKAYISTLFQNYEFQDSLRIFLGTDKDIFTQLFLNRIKKQALNFHVTMVDEGLGFYKKIGFKDKVISGMYKFLTPILFKEKLLYIKRLGVHPDIRDMYLRFPELRPTKSGKVRIIPFSHGTKDPRSRILKTDGRVLLFSFPNDDYLISDYSKIDMINSIFNEVKYHGKTLVIKPHPRENIEVLKKRFNEIEGVEILPRNLPGECLNYFDFELIVNFFSSLVLDLLSKKYPIERIITIGFTRKPTIELPKSMFYNIYGRFDAKKELKILEQ